MAICLRDQDGRAPGSAGVIDDVGGPVVATSTSYFEFDNDHKIGIARSKENRNTGSMFFR